MKVVFSDAKKGLKKIRIDSLEDLWHLSNIIRKSDKVEGRTFRAVKFGNKEERKPVFIGIEVENVEFSKLKESLRVGGKIIYGKPEEFIQKGRYHTLEFRAGDEITIIKEWMKYEEERIREAIKESKREKAYIILVDDSKIIIAKLLSYGIEMDEIEVYRSKREEKEKISFDFLDRLNKDVLVIVAGPGFSKEKVIDYLRKRGYRVYVEEASYAEVSGIIELVERGVLSKILEETALERESKLIGEFEKHVFKGDGLAVYGESKIKEAAEIGAIEKLLMIDEYISKEEKREIAKKVEKNRGKVYVFSSSSPWGNKLKGYGGVVGILRFPME